MGLNPSLAARKEGPASPSNNKAMAFDRLQKLGKEKFQKIVNELARGTPAQTLARLIQQEWGDAQDVREETLAK